MTRLTDNAIDFLNRAIDDFKTQPKYSIINFNTAVELFLKARLVHEHWSLIVLRDADRQKFEAGDFVSVTFHEACERLQNIVQSPVPEGARKTFDAIRKHRNKMVHFFHEADRGSGPKIEAIATEQLRAWYDLHKLLTTLWGPIFFHYNEEFSLIEKKLRGHREFLRARFDDLAASIKVESSKGIQFGTCASCGFKAARINTVLGELFESGCLVCRHHDKWFNYICSDCDTTSPLHEGGEFLCPVCGKTDKQQTIFDRINEFVATSDNYVDAGVPAHCAECEGYHSVAEYEGHYLCVVCFYVSEEIAACGWCGEFGNGDMEDSNMEGCTVCDGSIGHHMSKND
jgi:hypothetical protein